MISLAYGKAPWVRFYSISSTPDLVLAGEGGRYSNGSLRVNTIAARYTPGFIFLAILRRPSAKLDTEQPY